MKQVGYTRALHMSNSFFFFLFVYVFFGIFLSDLFLSIFLCLFFLSFYLSLSSSLSVLYLSLYLLRYLLIRNFLLLRGRLIFGGTRTFIIQMSEQNYDKNPMAPFSHHIHPTNTDPHPTYPQPSQIKSKLFARVPYF